METVKPESKYERLRRIGIGSYGVVFKCVNRQTGQVVAIKRYSENDSDPIIRKIAMREVRMLRQLKHPNLINLIEVFRRKRRLHLVFDYCELTVLDVIEKYTNNCPVNLIKKIIWQTVNGINYCHTHNCIHRDIKPENILINQAGVVKLCDFGFARNILRSSADSSLGSLLANSTGSKSPLRRSREDWLTGSGLALERQALTEYVATRWYRAPELLIGEIYYDVKIDIWAIGCVTAELMRGEPIWPGKTDVDQLCIIKSSLGHLTPVQTQTLLAQSIYDQPTIERILAQPTSSAEALDRKLPGQRVGQAGVEFVAACLEMDPGKRPSSEQLLRHAYIQSARMGQFVVGGGGQFAQQLAPLPAAPLAASPSESEKRRLLGVVESGGNNRSPAPTGVSFTLNGSKTNSQSLMLLANSTTSNQQNSNKLPNEKPNTKLAELKGQSTNGSSLVRQKRRQSINGNSSQPANGCIIPAGGQNAIKTSPAINDSPRFAKSRQRAVNGLEPNGKTAAKLSSIPKHKRNQPAAPAPVRDKPPPPPEAALVAAAAAEEERET